MSLMKTKPRWCMTAVATNQGWVNPASGELLVAIGNLAAQLEAEQRVATPVPVAIMPTVETQLEPVIVKEAKIRKPKKGQQVIAEVVEYDIDKEIIGE